MLENYWFTLQTGFYHLMDVALAPGQVLHTAFSESFLKGLVLCSTIVFLETGCIFFPFLPGDCLLVLMGGTLAQLNQPILPAICYVTLATTFGSFLNYLTGLYFGRALDKFFSQYHWFQESRARSECFMRKHGLLSVALSRWIGWVRTFVPFVSGLFQIPFKNFMIYNFFGALIWVSGFVTLGALFKNWIPFVSTVTTIGVVGLPLVVGLFFTFIWVRDRLKSGVVK